MTTFPPSWVRIPTTEALERLADDAEVGTGFDSELGVMVATLNDTVFYAVVAA